MSRQCAICGKKGKISRQRKKLMSRHNPTIKKKKYPNLQWVTLPSGKRVKACTKCIKKMGKKK